MNTRLQDLDLELRLLRGVMAYPANEDEWSVASQREREILKELGDDTKPEALT